MIKIFDGHNDTLLGLFRNSPTDFFQIQTSGHIDFPRALRGGFAGGFFALFTPSAIPSKATSESTSQSPEPVFIEPITHHEALTKSLQLAATLFRLERLSKGSFEVLRSIDQLLECLESETIGAILHLEGAEAIDADLNYLEVLYATGLRSLGIVWSRPNIFGTGVPISTFPATPDIGPGLTEQGKCLVSACNELGIMIDLSHINEKGFWDVEAISNKPLVATHSNSHSLCQSPRNLTDNQLSAIAKTEGVVGVNFGVRFLREDGKSDTSTPISQIINHVNYFVDTMGINHVAFGSDFDGTAVPKSLGDVEGLPKLVDALREAGYGDTDIKKIAFENWVRVLRTTWQR